MERIIGSRGIEVNAGTRLVFMGERWTVRRVVYGGDWRDFYSIESDSGAHDCIAADGSDGGYQLLPATTRDSDQDQRGAPGPPRGVDAGPAETLASSPAVARSARSLEVAGSVNLGGVARPLVPVLPLGRAASSPLPTIAEPIPDRFNPQPWRP